MPLSRHCFIVVVIALACTPKRVPLTTGPETPDSQRIDLTVVNRALTPEGVAVHVFPEHGASDDARDPRGVLFSEPATETTNLEMLTTNTLPLSYHSGPLLLHAKVVNIWWGDWSAAAGVAQRVREFQKTLGMSGEYGVITQYGDSTGNKISLADLTPQDVAFPNGATGIVSNAEVRDSLRNLIKQGSAPKPTADLLYVVLLAPGIASTTSDGWSSCNSGLNTKKYCGYHTHFSVGPVHSQFAVIVYPSCRGCQGHPIPGTTGPAAGITVTVEHEIREAATDKFLNAWFNENGEADDLCSWDTFVDGGYQHQREWSNAAMKCVARGINGP